MPDAKLDILPESGSENDVRCPPAKKRKADGRTVKLDQLLQRRCRCISATCFTQFQGMERAVASTREKFQSMDGKDKAKNDKTKSFKVFFWPMNLSHKHINSTK